jgi:hypothetical protein
MPPAAELTPHLAAAVPWLAALVPWLLAWGVTVIVLALAASVLIARGASRITEDTTIFGDAERRLRRARRLLLVSLASVVALWGLTWLAGGPDPMLTELIFAVLVAGMLGPTYVATRIFEGAMTRAVERTGAQRGHRPHPSPRRREGEGRD